MKKRTIRHTWKIVEATGRESEVWAQGLCLPIARELLEEVKEGDLIPKWYGFTYYDFERDVKVFAPLGLNWLIGFWRAARIFIKFSLSDRLTFRAVQLAYMHGWQDGIERSVKHHAKYSAS